jgi:hypothetical protein
MSAAQYAVIPAIVANHQLDARIADLSAEQRSGPS